jgi:transposase
MMNIRIRMSQETVKQMIGMLHRAYKSGDVKMVRRIEVLLDYSRGDCPTEIAARHGISVSSLYAWLKQLLVDGLESLKPRWKGGRPCKLTKQQKKVLGELIDGGPEAAGFGSGCWNSVLIQEVIYQHFGKLYNVHYVCELLQQLGFSFQKARFVSDHLDEAKRREWLRQTWPRIQAQAQAAGGLLLFGDEASFAQWGSLSYTWARKGQQPMVKTSGKRKAYKAYGLIDYFSGRFFYQGITGRFNADSYITFLSQVLALTRAPIFLIQDGARYHTAKKTRLFFAQHAHRLAVYQLPSYSPDYNPIEYLWRNVKKEATHLKYFPTFDHLLHTVEKTLADFQNQPERIHALFGLYLKSMTDPAGQPAELAA